MKMPRTSTTLLLIFLVLGGAFPVRESWGQTEEHSGFPISLVTSNDSSHTLFNLAPLMTEFQKVLSVKTSYVVPTAPLRKLQEVLRNGGTSRQLTVEGTASWLNGRLISEGQIGHSAPETMTFRTTPHDVGDAQHQLVRLSLTGNEGPFRFGLNYRSAGSAYGNLQDQTKRELWGEWRAGFARFRGSRLELWNNVEKDPARSRVTQVQEKVAITLTPTSRPELTLSYMRGTTFSSYEPAGTSPQRSQSHNLAGQLSYQESSWSMRLSSTYASYIDQVNSDLHTVTQVHTLDGTYRPTPALAIAPTVSWRNERQLWSGAHLSTPITGLSLTYNPGSAFHFTASGSYSRTSSTDGLIQNTSVMARTVANWTLQTSSLVQTVLALEAAYRSFHDAINPQLSTRDLLGLVSLQLIGF